MKTERERGKGIYRKMGLRRTFSRKEPFQDQVSLSQFLVTGLWCEAEAGPPHPGWTASPPAFLSSAWQFWLSDWDQGERSAQKTYRCDLLGSRDRFARLGGVGSHLGELIPGEKQHEGVCGHSSAAPTSGQEVKEGGWLERALRQAGQG